MKVKRNIEFKIRKSYNIPSGNILPTSQSQNTDIKNYDIQYKREKTTGLRLFDLTNRCRNNKSLSNVLL